MMNVLPCPGSSGHATISALLLLLLGLCGGFPMDDQVAVPLATFSLTATPTHVTTGVTENVSLRCAHAGRRERSRFENITNIQLWKKTVSGWSLLAEGTELRDPQNRGGSVVVSAELGEHVSASFLNVTWPVAEVESVGFFKCSVLGVDEKSRPVTEDTPEVSIEQERDGNSDLLTIVSETKSAILEDVGSIMADQKKQLDAMNSKIASLENKVSEDKDFTGKDISTLKQSVDSLNSNVASLGKKVTSLNKGVASLNQDVVSLKQGVSSQSQDTAVLRTDLSSQNHAVDSLSKTVASLSTNIASLEDGLTSVNTEMVALRTELTSLSADVSARMIAGSVPGDSSVAGAAVSTAWPSGRYALPATQTGCPADVGFAGPSESYVRFEIQFVHIYDIVEQRFCEAEVYNSKEWPRGAYCLARMANSPCPSGFHPGDLKLDIHSSKGHVDARGQSGDGEIGFCCRQDGYPTEPIVLPTNSPFQLYRTAGACQEVRGMTVQSSSFLSTSRYRWHESYVASGMAPDINVDAITSYATVYMCRYT